jgi:hypothetical protein
MQKYLYHGTSLHRWRELQASGHADTLYMANSMSGTEMYRLNAVAMDEAHEGVPENENAEVVVTFGLAKLAHFGKLQPDWDDVPSNMERFPDATYVEQVSWQDSLRQLGTVAYSGPIKGAVVRVSILQRD